MGAHLREKARLEHLRYMGENKHFLYVSLELVVWLNDGF